MRLRVNDFPPILRKHLWLLRAVFQLMILHAKKKFCAMQVFNILLHLNVDELFAGPRQSTRRPSKIHDMSQSHIHTNPKSVTLLITQPRIH